MNERTMGEGGVAGDTFVPRPRMVLSGGQPVGSSPHRFAASVAQCRQQERNLKNQSDPFRGLNYGCRQSVEGLQRSKFSKRSEGLFFRSVCFRHGVLSRYCARPFYAIAKEQTSCPGHRGSSSY
jgi:hypothetical protein